VSCPLTPFEQDEHTVALYHFDEGRGNETLDDAAIFCANLTVAQCKAIYNVGNSALAYSMADMIKLFALYAGAGGTTNTSDGRKWEYRASGLSGPAGALIQSGDYQWVVFADSGSAGVRTGKPAGTLTVLW
jgi:hypothetical protein